MTTPSAYPDNYAAQSEAAGCLVATISGALAGTLPTALDTGSSITLLFMLRLTCAAARWFAPRPGSGASGADAGISRCPNQCGPSHAMSHSPRSCRPVPTAAEGATCHSRSASGGPCRLVSSGPLPRTVRHRLCLVVTDEPYSDFDGTRRHRTARPVAVRHEPALAVPGRTVRDLLRAHDGRACGGSSLRLSS